MTTWRRVIAQAGRPGGAGLPTGAQLLLMLMGSGSDPEVFPNPERMCPNRAGIRRHLPLGAGRHRCPGASLARTEAAVALPAAARGLTDIRPAAATAEPSMLCLLSFRASLKMVVEQAWAARHAPAPHGLLSGHCHQLQRMTHEAKGDWARSAEPEEAGVDDGAAEGA